MKIYLATPVNGRKEKTYHLKIQAALKRIGDMAKEIRKQHPDAEFLSSFDIPAVRRQIRHPEEPKPLESDVMGWCVKMVMDCDMIVLDDGWEDSQGCTVERFVAMQYGKKVRTLNSFMLFDYLQKESAKKICF